MFHQKVQMRHFGASYKHNLSDMGNKPSASGSSSTENEDYTDDTSEESREVTVKCR